MKIILLAWKYDHVRRFCDEQHISRAQYLEQFIYVDSREKTMGLRFNKVVILPLARERRDFYELRKLVDIYKTEDCEVLEYQWQNRF